MGLFQGFFLKSEFQGSTRISLGNNFRIISGIFFSNYSILFYSDSSWDFFKDFFWDSFRNILRDSLEIFFRDSFRDASQGSSWIFFSRKSTRYFYRDFFEGFLFYETFPMIPPGIFFGIPSGMFLKIHTTFIQNLYVFRNLYGSHSGFFPEIPSVISSGIPQEVFSRIPPKDSFRDLFSESYLNFINGSFLYSFEFL